jgi:HEAT repeat protein
MRAVVLFGPPDVDRLKEKGDVKGLIKALQYRKLGWVREQAAWALGEIGDPRAVTPLVDLLTDRAAQAAAADALGEIGDPGAAGPLAVLLAQGDHRGVDSAVRALAKIGVPAVRHLVGAFATSDYSVFGATQRALAEIGPGAAEPLAASIDNKNPNVRLGVVETLGEIGEPSSVSALATALKDEEFRIREAAAAALGKIDDVHVVETLLAAAKSRLPGVRRAVLEALRDIALRDIGGNHAADALSQLLDDEDPDFRSAVADALRQLGFTPTDTTRQGAGALAERDHGESGAAPSDQRQEAATDFTESLSDTGKATNLLLKLKALRPSDPWLEQEVVTGWEWAGGALNDDAELVPVRERRGDVVEYVTDDDAAERVVAFWEDPQPDVLHPLYTAPTAQHRAAHVVGRKLVIKWKGYAVEEGRGGIGGTMRFEAEWRLTVARVDSECYAVVREQKP